MHRQLQFKDGESTTLGSFIWKHNQGARWKICFRIPEHLFLNKALAKERGYNKRNHRTKRKNKQKQKAKHQNQGCSHPLLKSYLPDKKMLLKKVCIQASCVVFFFFFPSFLIWVFLNFNLEWDTIFKKKKKEGKREEGRQAGTHAFSWIFRSCKTLSLWIAPVFPLNTFHF